MAERDASSSLTAFRTVDSGNMWDKSGPGSRSTTRAAPLSGLLRIRFRRDVLVGAVLSLAGTACSGALAWYWLFAVDSFRTPVSVSLLVAGIGLLLAQVWFFLLREGPTRMLAVAVMVHLVLFAMPLLVCFGV